MSEKTIIFVILVVYLEQPKQTDEIQISGEMKSDCFYVNGFLGMSFIILIGQDGLGISI